jgi:hypothetical protein
VVHPYCVFTYKLAICKSHGGNSYIKIDELDVERKQEENAPNFLTWHLKGVNGFFKNS